MEKGFQVDSVYTDVLKAFDKVRHCLLLLKFVASSVEPVRCELLCSYLSGRIQRIRVGDCVSSEIYVTSGVPQGSHLVPLCFIWFVNDISRIFIYVRVLFYADDMKLFRVQELCLRPPKSIHPCLLCLTAFLRLFMLQE
jgi:Reverse transcriptase (RNA-dependent DNA polymerase)